MNVETEDRSIGRLTALRDYFFGSPLDSIQSHLSFPFPPLTMPFNGYYYVTRTKEGVS